jgi:hypothetical protein
VGFITNIDSRGWWRNPDEVFAHHNDPNASVILSASNPSYEDAQCAAREVEQAKDKRALADCLDSAR